MLSPLIWIPTIGALIIAFLPKKLSSMQIRTAALAVSGVALLWTNLSVYSV